jgi:N-methylhydantoinase A/oxoprolinase/acetone carboxylase beta subunit
MPYFCGVDTGGTFTDCVVMDEQGQITIAKSQSTPKDFCAMTERPLKTVNPHLLDPKTYMDEKIVFRSYACPSCGLLIQAELARPTDSPLWDVQLA